MRFSNVTPGVFSEFFQKVKANQTISEVYIKQNIVKSGKTTDCKHAEDTGRLAFERIPCKGNKIICHHPDNDGMVTYAKLCNRANCKFYRSKEMTGI